MQLAYPRNEPIDNLTPHYPWPVDGRWVRASMVSTVDGSGVGPDGRSGSISTPADFELFKALRNDCDVIIVGAGTARGESYNPPRSARLAVVTRSAQLNPALPFISAASSDALPLVLTCEKADSSALAALAGRAEIVFCGTSSVDLPRALAELQQRGMRRMVVEGGPQLLTDLFADDLVDELDLQITPFLAGGSYTTPHTPGRILSGAALPSPPAHLTLEHVITDGATLFLRYIRSSAPHTTRSDD